MHLKDGTAYWSKFLKISIVVLVLIFSCFFVPITDSEEPGETNFDYDDSTSNSTDNCCCLPEGVFSKNVYINFSNFSKNSSFRTDIPKVRYPSQVNLFSVNSQTRMSFDGYKLLDLDDDLFFDTVEWSVNSSEFNNYEVNVNLNKVSFASSTSDIINNYDGTKTLVLYSRPINYFNVENNDFEPINTSIVTSSSSDFFYENTKNVFKSYFDLDGKVKFQVGHVWGSSYPVDQSFANLQNSTVELDGSHIIYHDIYENVDLRYTISSSNILEEFIVKNPINISKLSTALNFSGVYYVFKNNTLDFFNQTTNEYLFSIPEPVMWEEKDVSKRSYGINYSLEQSNGSLYLSKILTEEGLNWLEDENRTYPVVIDATWSNNNPTEDGYVNYLNPPGTYSQFTSTGDLVWCCFMYMSRLIENRSYVEWDISAISGQGYEINDVDFKYQGIQNELESKAINSMEKQPSSNTAQGIYTDAGNGSAYVTSSTFPEVGTSKSVDLGDTAVEDLQSACDNSQSWWAIGITAAASYLSPCYDKIVSEDYSFTPRPPPTLYVTYTDNIPPETYIDNIPEPAGPSHVSNITGLATDEDGNIDGVYLNIRNDTDSTNWCGSYWSNICPSVGVDACGLPLSASATDGNFNDNEEYWYYNCDSAGLTWSDGKQYTITAKARDEDNDCDSSAASDTFNYSSTAGNSAPEIDERSESPKNGSTGISLYPQCSIAVRDPDSDDMMIQFWENSTGTWARRQTNETVGDGTYKWDYTQASTSGKKYWWRIHARDLYQNLTPNSYGDESGSWANETKAYDEDTGTYSSCTHQEAPLELGLSSGKDVSAIRIYGSKYLKGEETGIDNLVVRLSNDSGSSYTTIYEGSLEPNTWVTIDNTMADCRDIDKALIMILDEINEDNDGRIKEFKFVETDENTSTYFFTTQSTEQFYTPIINSYDLRNSTGSKLNNATGPLDNEKEYYFTINVTDDNGWGDINYINITSWYDNGNEASNYNDTAGGNLNMFLQYKNTTETKEFNLLWPNDEVQIISNNCSETIINETTREIKISFKPKGLIRWGESNDTWSTTDNTTNDVFSWNFKINVADNSSRQAWTENEYGISKYTNITTDQSDLYLTVAPGYSGNTNIVTITFQSNYDYVLKIYFENNLTNSSTGNKIFIANNLYVLADADTEDDIETDQAFNGVGEKNAIEILNTSGIFSDNNCSQTIQSQFQVNIPLGTYSGVYTSRIATEITQK